MSERPAPNPGSPEALALGCLCSQGLHPKFGVVMFSIEPGCALHNSGSPWSRWYDERAELHQHLRAEIDSGVDIGQLEAMRARRTEARRRRRAMRSFRHQLDQLPTYRRVLRWFESWEQAVAWLENNQARDQPDTDAQSGNDQGG